MAVHGEFQNQDLRQFSKFINATRIDKIKSTDSSLPLFYSDDLDYKQQPSNLNLKSNDVSGNFNLYPEPENDHDVIQQGSNKSIYLFTKNGKSSHFFGSLTSKSAAHFNKKLADQHFQQGGFANPVRADKCHPVSAEHPKIKWLQNNSVAKALCQSAGFDHTLTGL